MGNTYLMASFIFRTSWTGWPTSRWFPVVLMTFKSRENVWLLCQRCTSRIWSRPHLHTKQITSFGFVTLDRTWRLCQMRQRLMEGSLFDLINVKVEQSSIFLKNRNFFKLETSFPHASNMAFSDLGENVILNNFWHLTCISVGVPCSVLQTYVW